MSLKQLVIVSILGWSSLAFADPDKSAEAPAPVRHWTIHAASNHEVNAQSKKEVTDPGIRVTAQRDPHDKK